MKEFLRGVGKVKSFLVSFCGDSRNSVVLVGIVGILVAKPRAGRLVLLE